MGTVSLDLKKSHAAHKFGDIIQILTWVNDERAMVLLPALRKGAPWFIVCESAAWKYDDPVYLARQARQASKVLGMDETRDNWVKIATIIHDSLPDLIRMPSSPPAELLRGSFGSMEVREDGKTIAREDVRFEKDGLTFGA